MQLSLLHLVSCTIAVVVADRVAIAVSVQVVQFMFVQIRARGALLKENISFEPPRSHRAHLIPGVGTRGDGEDIVEFLQSALLGLRLSEVSMSTIT